MKKRYLVFRSPQHTEGRIMFCMGPIIILFVAWKTKQAFLVYLILPIAIIAFGYAFILFLANLSFDERGVYCHRPFQKTIFLKWESIGTDDSAA